MTITKIRRWTVEEYHRMIDKGILTSDDQVELLNGLIVEVSPQRPPHAGIVQRASDYIKAKLTNLAHVRMQLPITLATSEPEPDIAVVRIDPGAYGDHHPSSDEILLLIEVSYTTLEIDRFEKALIYAKAGIADYWVLDVNENQVYIFRQPSSDGYQFKRILTDSTSLFLLAFPDVEISF